MILAQLFIESNRETGTPLRRNFCGLKGGLHDWGLCGGGSLFIPRAKEKYFAMIFAE